MSITAGRGLWYVVVPLLLVTALGSLIFWVAHALLSRNELDEATQLASIALPVEPSLLAWSADGTYIAAGTGYTTSNQVHGPAKVYIVDVGKQAVIGTLETAAAVDGLALSPDGKWLAMATSVTLVNDKFGAAELVVFVVPEFTAKLQSHSARKTTDGQRDGHDFFVDIAWAPDGKSLYAIDGGMVRLGYIRRWTAPEFVE